jgi:hypothetical protein
MNYLLVVILLAITFDVAWTMSRNRTLDDVVSAFNHPSIREDIRREIMLRLETL